MCNHYKECSFMCRNETSLEFLNLGFGLTLKYWTKSEQYHGFTYTGSFWQRIQFFVLKYFNDGTVEIWESHFFVIPYIHMVKCDQFRNILAGF